MSQHTHPSPKSGIRHSPAIRRNSIKLLLIFALGIVALVLLGLLPPHAPSSNHGIHTMIETAATVLALLAGAIALLRYQARRDFIYLAIGVGFIGTGLLDGYHAIVTSTDFAPFMPTGLSGLIPWSWFASRLFLSILLVLSLISPKSGQATAAQERFVLVGSGLLCLATFVGFAFIPLPIAIHETLAFPRPLEFLPAFLFLVALMGYSRRAVKRGTAFDFWLVATLLANFLVHAPIMARSLALFDLAFDAAHILKLVAYVIVLAGLLQSVARAFRDVEHQSEDLTEALKQLNFRRRAMDEHAIVSVADQNATILYANDKYCRVSGYSASELVGTRHPDHLSPNMDQDVFQTLWDTISSGKSWQGELVHRSKTGEDYWVQATILPYDDRESGQLHFVSIQTDISTEKRREADLLEARQNADRANRAKSEFLASMSHELRTPLNAILGYSQFMQLDSVEIAEAKKREYVDHIRSAGEHLLHLVNQVLDLSKIESDDNALELEPISPLDAITDSLDQIHPMARDHNITLINRCEGLESLTVIGDQLRFKQVIINLLSNGIKYNHPGGQLAIEHWCHRSGSYCVAVTDTGIGIPSNKKRSLFTLFQRLEDNALLASESSGVGLYVTKMLMERMQGGIEFVSIEGMGSCFMIWLPCSEDCAPATSGLA